MSQNQKYMFGDVAVEATPTQAFKGYGGRVFENSQEAVVDIATNELAKLWLRDGPGSPPFSDIMNYIESCPELFEAAVHLARFKHSTLVV